MVATAALKFPCWLPIWWLPLAAAGGWLRWLAGAAAGPGAAAAGAVRVPEPARGSGSGPRSAKRAVRRVENKRSRKALVSIACSWLWALLWAPDACSATLYHAEEEDELERTCAKSCEAQHENWKHFVAALATKFHPGFRGFRSFFILLRHWAKKGFPS